MEVIDNESHKPYLSNKEQNAMFSVVAFWLCMPVKLHSQKIGYGEIRFVQAGRLQLLVGCVQVYLSSNQVVGFFDEQYLKRKPVDILVFYAQN